MKKINLKRFYIWLIISLMSMTIIFTSMNVGEFKAFATSSSSSSFCGVTGSPNGETLYNATNTCNYNGDNNLDNRAYVYYDTSIDGKNTNTVSTGVPLITVLTHGLDGDASHWSNVDDKFAYDEESMFARLEQELLKNGGYGANVYWAVMQNSTEFELYNLNDESNQIVKRPGTDLEYIEYKMSRATTAITDISKHIIIIFQSSVRDEYNYKVYEEFNYMLSKIVYDVKMLSGGELPQINLIGHSRGGITNLQYALDHPDLVASMFSLGTPYFGSDTAATSLGADLAPGNGRMDIISRDIYLDYFNRWYNDYNRLYSRIDAHALGGYSDSDYLFDALIASDNEYIEGKFSDENFEKLKTAIKHAPGLVSSLDTLTEISDYLVSFFRDECYNESELESYIQIVADIQYFAYDDSEGFWENLWDNIVHNFPFVGCPYFMNDLLVDLSSQIGIDQHSDTYRSYGFKLYMKCYENSDFNESETKKLSSSTMPAVVHNLEARDEDMIDYILSNISLGGYEGYLYKQTSATTATLVGYCGDIILNQIVLPAQVDGLTVNCIGSDLFKGKGDNITTIMLPNTVETLKDYAFIGLKSLVNVEISENSNLTSIGSMAFSGCEELISFNVTSMVTNIASDAFIGCRKLVGFTVDERNSRYSQIDGVLFNEDGTQLLYFPNGKTIDSYILHTNIIHVGAYAFSENSNVEELHIYGTPIIDDYAFYRCGNLEKVYFYSYTIPEMGTGTFMNNTFTLYVPHCKQNAYNTEFVGYTSSIASIPITITFIIENEIYQTYSTYYGADIVEVPVPFKEGYTFNYWTDENGNIYQNGGIWDSTEDLTVYADWTARQSYINFSGYGTDGIEDKLVTYDEPIGVLPLPNSTGPVFIGWKDEHGEYYSADTIWKRTNNLTLFADFEGVEEGNTILYYVDLDQDGGMGGSDNVRAVYMESMPSATAPSRTGYIFLGYYTGTNGAGVKYYNADMSSARVWDIPSDKTLYACWQGLQFTVTLDQGEGSGGTESVVVTYGSKMPTEGVLAPTLKGYTFDGYYDDGNKQYYTGPNLSSDVTWEELESITLTAKWIKNYYNITLHKGYTEVTNNISVGYEEIVGNPDLLGYSCRVGYDFHGFYSQPNGGGTKYLGYTIVYKYSEYRYQFTSTNETWDIDADGILYAYWTLISDNYKYEVIFSNEEEPRKTYSIYLSHGGNVTITAPTIDGYTFKEMWVNGSYYQTSTYQLNNVQLKRNLGYGIDGYENLNSFYLWYPTSGPTGDLNSGGLFMVYEKSACVVEGTLITLADGRQVPVESLTGKERLLVWNLHTGQFDTAPILFIDHDMSSIYKIINLRFSDGTQVKVIDEHAFWDFDLNKYVFIREDASKYIGHWFNKQITDANGNMTWTRVQLTSVTITEELTTAWSPVTYGHLCIYVNGMLSMPGATEGLINIFEVNGNTMQINQEQYFADIEMYGLFTYEEFAEIYSIPEEIFNAVNGQYLKVSIGKGLIDYETLGELIERYSKFF